MSIIHKLLDLLAFLILQFTHKDPIKEVMVVKYINLDQLQRFSNQLTLTGRARGFAA